MSNRLDNIENYFKYSDEGYVLLKTKIINKKYHILLKCPNELHDSYWVTWQHFKNRGDRCGKCRYINNGKKKLIYSENKIKEIVKDLNYDLIKIKSIGDEGKITISSKEGYIIDTSINNIIRSSIPAFFSEKNQYTTYNIKLWCKSSNKSYLLVDNTYCNAKKNLNWKCLVCGENFERSWNVTQKGLYDCPCCSGRKVSKQNNLLIINPVLSKQWNYIKNHPIRPEQVLPNTTKKFWWICNDCSFEWEKSVHYRNQKNSHCPNCKMSKGEYAVKSYLLNNNINYICEHSFNKCLNVKKLRFDFYLPEYNTCIEYQGEFHYNILKGITSEEILESQKNRDKIKREFCNENNIELIEIPYWEFKNIESLLNEYIRNCNKKAE